MDIPRSVTEATRIMLEALPALGAEEVALRDAFGRVTAEEFRADRDLPPFDRVAMDGIALRYAACAAGRRRFRVLGTQAAGAPPLTLSDPEGCIEVMTGAVLPRGADTVVPYERIDLRGAEASLLTGVAPRSGQNVHTRATDQRQGDLLVRPGRRFSAAEIGLAATIGKSSVRVRRLPRTAIISTGDELVHVSARPAEHQIRISNAPTLRALLLPLGLDADTYHLPDNANETVLFLREALRQHDLLIFTGGISRGKYDFVPASLIDAGIRPAVTHLRQRPGKPLWFGQSAAVTVFGLPGNPVSALVGGLRYVVPWVRASLGLPPFPETTALLTRAVATPREAAYFLSVQVAPDAGSVLRATPRPGKGSGDLANLATLSGFLEIPEEQAEARPGQAYRYFPLRTPWP